MRNSQSLATHFEKQDFFFAHLWKRSPTLPFAVSLFSWAILTVFSALFTCLAKVHCVNMGYTSAFIHKTWLLLTSVFGWMSCSLVELLLCDKDTKVWHFNKQHTGNIYTSCSPCRPSLTMSFTNTTVIRFVIRCSKMLRWNVSLQMQWMAFRFTPQRDSFQFTAMHYACCLCCLCSVWRSTKKIHAKTIRILKIVHIEVIFLQGLLFFFTKRDL